MVKLKLTVLKLYMLIYLFKTSSNSVKIFLLYGFEICFKI